MQDFTRSLKHLSWYLIKKLVCAKLFLAWSQSKIMHSLPNFLSILTHMLFYSYQPTYYVIFYVIQSFTKSLCHVIFYVISNIKCWHLLCVMVYQKLQWVSWIPELISQKHHLKKLISFSCFMFLEMLNGKRVKRKKKKNVYCSKLEIPKK